MNITFDKPYAVRAKVSKEFKQAISERSETLTDICNQTGMNLSRLSRILNDAEIPKTNDERIKRVAKVIGFTGQIFEPAVKA